MRVLAPQPARSASLLWIMTASGLDLFHSKNETFEHVYTDRELPNCFFKINEDSLLVGTERGLVEITRRNGEYIVNPIKSSPKVPVLNIQKDNKGNLWLRTNKGLLYHDRTNGIWLEFDDSDGIKHTAHYYSKLHVAKSGRLIAVDRDGISFFDPQNLHISHKKTFPQIIRLSVNNEAPTIGTVTRETFLIPFSISTLTELTLDHVHNHFTLEFAAMQMTAPEKNLYRHMLEGYDPDWIETDYKDRTATYTNLPAGTYTFRVKASNHHGVWSDNERTLKVIILPPPWRTWWAYTGYGLLVAGLLVWARRNIVQRERLKANLRLEQLEREKEHFELEKAKEVDKVKTSFFTNISHEFRTPLTLIKGPVQNMIEQFVHGQNEIDRARIAEQLKLVQRNSDHLLKLINQLLDLARLESGTLKVERSEGDLNSFINAVGSTFASLARQKNIQFTVELPEQRYTGVFDKDKVETILINLINNALKFTPSSGSVVVTARVTRDPDTLTLRVRDTGIGIPPEHQSKIFERFHQVSESHKEVGTGIGLALVRELVVLMNGNISVTSEVGKGSEFVAQLPVQIIEGVGNALVAEEAQLSPGTDPLPATPDSQTSTADREAHAGKPYVLVVEDNTDLRHFIIDALGREFNFLEAENGVMGLLIAGAEVPDLIISDVMMPEMDGVTMTGKIKKDIRTSHIPLILLTAKSTEDSKLHGLESGADDYLTKPFNKSELLLKVRNAIGRQFKLREKLRAELMSTAPPVEVLSADEQFLNKVKETILNRLSDEQLSVESLAEEIGLSRVQLYRKITALTGLSVNELIRKLRLQKASQLLAQKWGPVSQVAYEVGFSNLSYCHPNTPQPNPEQTIIHQLRKKRPPLMQVLDGCNTGITKCNARVIPL